MEVDEPGPWTPMSVSDAVELFRSAAFRWWLSGGHALDAHVGRSWRDHDDTDIAICRTDAPRLRSILDGWDIHIAAAGVLSSWHGRPLDAEASENNLWCRPDPASLWMLDITVGGGNEQEWIYRRDPAIRRRWDDAVLTSAHGVPYLAPELQLLFKAKSARPKDDLDAAIVIPLLEPARRTWLAIQLPAEHRWQTTIAGSDLQPTPGNGMGPLESRARLLQPTRRRWSIPARNLSTRSTTSSAACRS